MQDRTSCYFKERLKAFVFGELSEDYLSRASELGFLAGVPMPFKSEDLKGFGRAEGLDLITLSDNVIQVLGCDPDFPYLEQYRRFLRIVFEGKECEALLAAGRGEWEHERLQQAAVYFRAALEIDPEQPDALYGYALLCQALYDESEDADYVGRFKAQATECLEDVTRLREDFAPAYYHLGFAYLNLGLYTKAYFTWKLFLEKGGEGPEREEILERMETLREPMEIEAGSNHVLAGRWQQGIEALEPFLRPPYQDWWPLSYYLGAAYEGVGRGEDAAEAYRRVLRLNPSHLESLAALQRLSDAAGDAAQAEKYRKKEALIRSQLARPSEQEEE